MTITAKLSRRFYEQFGDQIVDELVNLLNNVDENSRSSLKELNEANFARFDAKMEQRIVESEARLTQRFAEFEVRVDRRFAETDQRVTQLGADLRVEMHAMRSDMLKWMFIFFTGSALANILLK